jgi:6-pyruvoyltetrahydropterin/6-carboxytetrahydropterin synthase
MAATLFTRLPARDLPVLRVVKRIGFCAAHWYRRAEWTDAQNEAAFYACANPHGHGHNYVLEVGIAGPCQPDTGMVVNLTAVKQWLQQYVVNQLDHKNLNMQIPHFATTIPTLENLLAYLWQVLLPVVEGNEGLSLTHLKLIENETLYATCTPKPESPAMMTHLTRRYDFAAAHRLFNPTFSNEQNDAIFGLCNNPNGHGHNYDVWLTLSGTPDPQTGMLADIVWLDNLVKAHIIDHVDHKHLNLDVPFLSNINPTAENLAWAFWQQLAPHFSQPAGPQLHRVRIVESRNNYADYFGA